jgi:hypothetical protein
MARRRWEPVRRAPRFIDLIYGAVAWIVILSASSWLEHSYSTPKKLDLLTSRSFRSVKLRAVLALGMSSLLTLAD